MKTRPQVQNDNGCGQGFHPSHLDHPCHPIAIRFGYKYSHSTIIGAMGGAEWYLAHCYTHGRHTLSFETWEIQTWGHKLKARTSTSTASGQKHTTFNMGELENHLAYKAKKYKLTQATK